MTSSRAAKSAAAAAPLSDEELAQTIAAWSARPGEEAERVLRLLAEVQRLRLRFAIREDAVGAIREILGAAERVAMENANLKTVLVAVRAYLTGAPTEEEPQEIIQMIDRALETGME